MIGYVVAGLAAAVAVVFLIDLARHSSTWHRRWRIIIYVGWRFIFSLAAPYILAAVPIVTHWIAVLANQGTMDVRSVAFTSAFTADGYLFSFIVSTSGVVDAMTLTGEKRWHGRVLGAFLLFAGASGLCYYNALLDVIVTRPTKALVEGPFWLVLAFCAGFYGLYKITRLYAEGKADLAAHAARRASAGSLKPGTAVPITEEPS